MTGIRTENLGPVLAKACGSWSAVPEAPLPTPQG